MITKKEIRLLTQITKMLAGNHLLETIRCGLMFHRFFVFFVTHALSYAFWLSWEALWCSHTCEHGYWMPKHCVLQTAEETEISCCDTVCGNCPVWGLTEWGWGGGIKVCFPKITTFFFNLSFNSTHKTRKFAVCNLSFKN